MKHTTILKSAFIAAAMTSSLSAATITGPGQEQTFAYTPTGTAALTFNQFDSSLGTLTGITITTEVTKEGGSLFVDNDSAVAASGDISQFVVVTLTGPDLFVGSGAVSVTATSTYTASVLADDGDGVGLENSGVDYDGTAFTDLDAAETAELNPAAFAAYTGNSTVVLNAGGTQGIDISGVGGVDGTFSAANVSGKVTVTYTYDAVEVTAVPEPSSAALLGLGGLGLLLRRRRA